MLIVDYSQLAIAGLMQFQDNLKRSSSDQSVDLIRHVVLSSLLSNKRKFGKEYGDVIIASDSRKYWRKSVFPFYKAHRAADREKSDLDWKLIFDTLSSIRDDLRENFPYKVIEVEGAEADDIIGVLAKWSQENELKQVGILEEPQPVLILSSDQDNFQCHQFKNVKQFAPMHKKFVKPTNAKQALIDKICTGDRGDGIPNIMSADNSIVEGIRQKPFPKKRLEEFYANGIDACKNEVEKRNFQRNQQIVSYEFIPDELRQSIIDTYKTTTPKGSKKTIYQYLVKNRCKNLLMDIEDF